MMKQNTTDKKLETDIVGFFDSVAGSRNSLYSTDPIFGYEQQVRLRSVLQMLELNAADFVLDVGCGNGRDLLELLDRKFDNFLAVDISPEMIAEAKKELAKRNVDEKKASVGSATALEFSDNTFDKVFASEVIEHIPEWEKSLKEMHRVLKPGGYLVITTPNARSWYGFDNAIYRLILKVIKKDSIHPYDEWKHFSKIKKAMESAGFKVTGVYGGTYLPGFLLVYRLPNSLKKVLVSFISKIEPTLAHMFPKHGYMLGIKAQKI